MMNNNFRQIWENIFQISQAVFRVTHLFPKDEILRRHLRAKITEILYQSTCHSERSEESKKYENLTKEIHDFRSFLFTAKNCNFVDEKNIAVLIKECENLLEKIDKLSVDSSRCHSQDFVCHSRPSLCHSRESGNPDSEFPKDEIFIPQPTMSFPSASGRINLRRESRPLPTPNFQIQNSTQQDIGFFVPNPRQQKILDYFKKNNKEKIRLKDVADEFRNISQRTVRGDLRELCDNGHLTRNGNGAGSYYHLPNNAS